MATTPMTTYSANELIPAIYPELARTDNVAIAASQNIAAGTILGEVGGINATSTITITASTSGGSFKLTTTVAPTLAQTGAINWSATNATLLANIQTALNAAYGTTGGAPNVVPTAVSLTAGIGTILLTSQNAFGGRPITWTLQDSTTGGTGVTVASTTTGVVNGGSFKARDTTATDGSQVAKVIAKFDMQTDVNGKVTFSSTSGQAGGPFGQTSDSAPVWITGYFYTQDLTGLDATAITQLGHMERGGYGSGQGGILRVI